MKNNDELKLRKGLNDNFLKVQREAMTQCAVAICSVVLDKATAGEKDVDEKLNDVIEFCKVSLGNQKK